MKPGIDNTFHFERFRVDPGDLANVLVGQQNLRSITSDLNEGRERGHNRNLLYHLAFGNIDDLDFIVFDLDGDRIVAAVAMNRGRDIAASRRLIERRVAVDRKRLTDDAVPLRDLLNPAT